MVRFGSPDFRIFALEKLLGSWTRYTELLLDSQNGRAIVAGFKPDHPELFVGLEKEKCSRDRIFLWRRHSSHDPPAFAERYAQASPWRSVDWACAKGTSRN